MKTPLSIACVAATLSACASQPPSVVQVTDYSTPAYGGAPTAHTTTQMMQARPQNASLWTAAPNALLAMNRAKAVGDLLTVVVEMDDQASVQSSLSRSRASGEDLGVDAFFGLPEWAGGVLPGGATLSPAFDFDRNSSLNGNGAVNRAEKIEFRLAARVVAVEPNGNLVIQGYQQTQVSNEVRYLSVSGVIRSQDITRDNTVTYEKIADAHLSYVNDGEATDAVERRAIPRILDTVIPF